MAFNSDWTRTIDLGQKQFVMMKNVSTAGKYVVDIFTQGPDRHKKNVPFVLYFQSTFDNESERDIFFKDFDEVQAMTFLDSIDKQIKVQRITSKKGLA